MKNEIARAQKDTDSIIEELLEDGSDPDALYLIEHHISSMDFDALEQVAVEAFKLGYEVTDPEEMLDEDNQQIICCDIIAEIPLDGDLINQQIEQLIKLLDKYPVNYDGWGTYFESGEDDEDIDETDENETIH